MKKLDWYIVKKFLGTFFFTLALILLIVIIFDVSEKIDDFLEHDVSITSIIFDYYFNFIPYFGNLFSPLFIFISVILFTSKMASDTEIIGTVKNKLFNEKNTSYVKLDPMAKIDIVKWNDIEIRRKLSWQANKLKTSQYLH